MVDSIVRRPLTLVLSFMLLVAVLGTAPASAVEINGSISGTITNDASGRLLGGADTDVTMTLYDASDTWLGTTNPDGSGVYVFSELAVGDYKVQAEFLGGEIQEIEWYDNAFAIGDATVVPVGAGVDVTGIDIAMTIGGSISGTVLDAVTGLPIEGIRVAADHTTQASSGAAVTAADGTYTIYELLGRNGQDYIVSFDDLTDLYLDEFYDDVPLQDAAIPVTVQRGANTAGINASLAIAGAISGTVTGGGGSTPIEMADVSIWTTDGTWITGAHSDATGTYLVPALLPGDYVVEVGSIGPYAGEWYNDKATLWTADTVTVNPGETTGGIDVGLAVGGWVEGTITDDATGLPIANTQVTIDDVAGIGFTSTVLTEADGTYATSLVPPGDYIAVFLTDDYDTEWFDDASDQASATVITVSAGAGETANAGLSSGGEFSGSVTDGNGSPIEGAEVIVYSWEGTPGIGDQPEYLTDASGNYTATGVPEGDYFIRFAADSHATIWYDGAADMASATTVTMHPAGSTISGIDAVLPHDPGILGVVTDSSTTGPIAGVEVRVYTGDMIWMPPAATTVTDAGGAFFVPLAAGDYTVEFHHEAYVDEWFDDVSSGWDATTVTVGSAGPTVVNASLVPGAAISGTVTDWTGAPVVGETVTAIMILDWTEASAVTDGAGNYMVDGLGAGEYVVQVDGGDQYAREYFSDCCDSYSLNTAVVLILDAGDTNSGKDVELVAGASISGTVTAETGGVAIPDVLVTTVLDDGFSDEAAYVESWFAETAGDGTYTVRGLPPGTVLTEFYGFDAYVIEWWNDARSQASASDILLAVGEDRTGIDAALTTAAIVEGTVTRASDGSPLADVEVELVDAVSGEYISGGISEVDGTYFIGGLMAGDYKLEFMSAGDTSQPYFHGWYNGEIDFDSATPITVSVGPAATVVDVVVSEIGSWLTGTVTDSSTALPLDDICVSAANFDMGYWVESGGYTYDGEYEIGLMPGNYGLYFYDCSAEPDYVSEWWDNGRSHLAATTIVVPDGGTPLTGFDAGLVPGAGRISGSVTDWSGDPIPGGACVSVRDENGGYIGAYGPTVGPSYSTYTVTGLPTGVDLRVRFDDCGTGEWGRTWFDGWSDVGTADSIVLAESEVRTGIDGVLGHFSDVPVDAWFFDHVEAIYAAGITSGYLDGTYRPAGLVSRSEMAVFLVRALDGPDLVPPKPATDPFPDVPVGHWASGWIARLVELGITSGYTDGTFRPAGKVNRAEMAVFLVRAIEDPANVPPKPVEDPFPDVPVSHWASGWIDRLVELGVTSGYGDGTYQPDRLVDRGEMATFLDRGFLGG